MSIFLIAGIVSAIFCLYKFLEMRFIEKEDKPFKLLIRDSLIVYISVVTGHFMMEQLSPFMEDNPLTASPNVFVDNPAF